MSKNVAVFVDVANIFYAAKAAGVDIDYVTLLKSATAGRDLVRAYAYTGLDPDNENQRNFHDFLRRSNYKVVSKDIRKYGDGKVKANLDIELVVDMMKTARNLDIAIVVSGDGDFAPAIRAVQEQGVRVEVISFRGNTSSDLIEVADQFTDIVQLARVEKGSRSGRRVAEDEADLSMTEVPDKLTEGSGAGRGRGRGRARTRDEEPVAAARGRGRGRATAGTPAGAVAASGAGLVTLPGERLARVGGLTEADLAAAEVFTLDELAAETAEAGAGIAATQDRIDEGEPRRRRRRGGRGRGRGRGRPDEATEAQLSETPRVARAPLGSADDVEDVVPARRAPRTTPFGSVWDTQLGTPTAPSTASLGPIADEEDFDEPEIPEYLIAEQRRGGGRGGGRGARGGRSAYQSAMERERYGRGGGGGGGRGGGHGINRYPDVSARPRPVGPREDRGYGRPEREPSQPARSSSEPWSDVPPELEALLRAQVAQKVASPTERGPQVRAERTPRISPEPEASRELAPDAATAVTEPKARPGRKPAARPARTAATKAAQAESAGAVSSTAAPVVPDVAAVGDATEAKPKRRTTRASKAHAAEGGTHADAPVGEVIGAAAKPRSPRKPATRKSAAAASSVGEPATALEPEAPATAPKRRTTRKASSAEPA